MEDSSMEDESIKSTPPTFIDGRYRVLKRFGDEKDGLRKMVFLARDLKSRHKSLKVIVKVYTLEESQAFTDEVVSNSNLHDSPHTIKMTSYVQP
jgi:hypothetical protein